MARKRRAGNEYDSDGGFVIGGGGDDSDGGSASRSKVGRENKRAKRAETAKDAKAPPPSSRATGKELRDDKDNVYWELPGSRRVTISEFNRKKLIHIREYYKKDGEMLPGRKGISLSIEQYSAFLGVVPEIETALKKQNEHVPRVEYGSGSSGLGAPEPEESEDGDASTGEDDDSDGDASSADGGNGEGRPKRKTSAKQKKNYVPTDDEDDEDED